MQNKFTLLGVGLIAGLLLGAGGAWGWMTLTAPPPEVPVQATVVKPDRIVKVVDEQALYEAKRQIADLKRQLADAEESVPDPEPKQPKVVKADGGSKNDIGQQVRDFVKTTLTPEQQAEIAAQRDAFRQQMEQRVTERNEFLASVDARNMNVAQRANHEKLLASVTRMNELRAILADGKVENAAELGKEMHDLRHSTEGLFQEERKSLLEVAGKNMGYSGEQATQFADQIKSIYDNTSVHGIWSGRQHGGGGGGFSGAAGAGK